MYINYLFTVSLVQSKAQAQAGIKNPLIGSVLQSVKAETGEEGAFALPKMPYEYGALGKFDRPGKIKFKGHHGIFCIICYFRANNL